MTARNDKLTLLLATLTGLFLVTTVVSTCVHRSTLRTLDLAIEQRQEFCGLVRSSLSIDLGLLDDDNARDRARVFAHFDGQGGNSSRDELALCAPAADLEALDACLAKSDTSCLSKIARQIRDQIAIKD